MGKDTAVKKDIGDEYWYNNRFRYDNVMWQSPLTTENFGISQIGEVYCRENISPPEHYQLFYELTFVVSGHGFCNTDGVTMELRPNMIYLSRPDEYHKITSDRDNSLRFMCIAFYVKSKQMQELVRKIFKNYGAKDNRILECVDAFSCMRSILSTFWSGELFYEAIVDLKLQEILYLIARTIPGTQPKKENRERNATMFNLISYIDSNFMNISSIKNLAGEFGYDYQHITKLFKKTFGMSIGEYITDKKLEYGKLLLTRHHKSVNETAELLGYSLPNNFSRAFKSKFGVTPREFKKR